RHPPRSRRQSHLVWWWWWRLGRPAREAAASRPPRRDGRLREPGGGAGGLRRRGRPGTANRNADQAVKRRDPVTAGELRESAERLRRKAAQQTAALRAELPLRYLRQQAHLTAPASDAKLAEKALSNATGVASRLLDRYGLDAKAVGERLGVDAGVVTSVLEEVGAPVVVLDLEDGVPPHLVDAARANVVRLAREIDRGRTLCFVR